MNFSHVAAAAVLLAGASAAPAADEELRTEVAVRQATRLDWEFAASAFGADAARVPADYDSTKQRYLLYVPRKYDAKSAWPLVLFISPGDEPLGWRYWQKTCEERSMLFCAAYGAGNNCPVGKRTRIVLDVLDDVRRHYRVDPDQTYLAGFSGGGRVACTIAFALPEYFGGVVPVCGTNPLSRLDYLRHRVQDRLSVAFVTGEKDFNRRENEDGLYPYFQDLSIRARLWVVPKLGHAIPGPDVIAEAHAWLADDLPRRRKDAETHAGLSASPDETPGSQRQSAGALEAAQAEMVRPGRLYRAAVLLQGIEDRWPKSAAAGRARALLRDLQTDPRLKEVLAREGGAEERRLLAARGRSQERLGDPRAALAAWDKLAKSHPDSEEGKLAAREAKRLNEALAKTPYLGVAFGGDGSTIQAVTPRGPADRAGLRAGDKLVKLGDATIGSLADLRRALQAHKPGDKATLEIRRDNKTILIDIEFAATPPPEKE